MNWTDFIKYADTTNVILSKMKMIDWALYSPNAVINWLSMLSSVFELYRFSAVGKTL